MAQDSIKRNCFKIPFDTKRDAREFIKIMHSGRKGRHKKYDHYKSGKKLFIYLCDKCDKDHTTTIRKPVYQNIKKRRDR